MVLTVHQDIDPDKINASIRETWNFIVPENIHTPLTGFSFWSPSPLPIKLKNLAIESFLSIALSSDPCWEGGGGGGGAGGRTCHFYLCIWMLQHPWHHSIKVKVWHKAPNASSTCSCSRSRY